jgi:NADPH-dependent FMN reductase
MHKPIRILGIAGSLRRESYNRAALRAATVLVPEGAILEAFELDGIPVFNQDNVDKSVGVLRTPPPRLRGIMWARVSARGRWRMRNTSMAHLLLH